MKQMVEVFCLVIHKEYLLLDIENTEPLEENLSLVNSTLSYNPNKICSQYHCTKMSGLTVFCAEKTVKRSLQMWTVT